MIGFRFPSVQLREDGEAGDAKPIAAATMAAALAMAKKIARNSMFPKPPRLVTLRFRDVARYACGLLTSGIVKIPVACAVGRALN
jgi:hypothetical protein